jgi:hypothetical protein
MTFIDPNSFARLVDPCLHDRPGGVFYSSPAAFSTPSKLYLLGLNPGGSAEPNTEATIGKNLATWSQRESGWCEYTSESWEGAKPGEYGIQRPIRALFNRLGLNVADVPASNVVFVRSNNEDKLDRKAELLERCWPVHEAVIRDLGVTTVLCLGQTAGRWARSMLGANQAHDQFKETYPRRHYRSDAHLSADGIAVLTLAHPSRSNWCDEKADPSPLVLRVLDR